MTARDFAFVTSAIYAAPHLQEWVGWVLALVLLVLGFLFHEDEDTE